jgi:spore coat polysaccharide biosynthesis protein SpsF
LGFDPPRQTTSRKPNDMLRILVSMGGADPFKLTELALDGLSRLKVPFQADIVVGPAFADPAGTVARIEGAGPGFRARTKISDMASLYPEADMAIVAFGVSAYEAAAFGVPAIYLPISTGHALSASVFVTAGLGVALLEQPSPDQITQAVMHIAENETLRQSMSATGPRLVDGRGALRIAAELAETAEKKS